MPARGKGFVSTDMLFHVLLLGRSAVYNMEINVELLSRKPLNMSD